MLIARELAKGFFFGPSLFDCFPRTNRRECMMSPPPNRGHKKSQSTQAPSSRPSHFPHLTPILRASPSLTAIVAGKTSPSRPFLKSADRGESCGPVVGKMGGKRGGKRTGLDLEAARASSTAGSFEFPAFAFDVRFLIWPPPRAKCQLRVSSKL